MIQKIALATVPDEAGRQTVSSKAKTGTFSSLLLSVGKTSEKGGKSGGIPGRKTASEKERVPIASDGLPADIYGQIPVSAIASGSIKAAEVSNTAEIAGKDSTAFLDTANPTAAAVDSVGAIADKLTPGVVTEPHLVSAGESDTKSAGNPAMTDAAVLKENMGESGTVDLTVKYTATGGFQPECAESAEQKSDVSFILNKADMALSSDESVGAEALENPNTHQADTATAEKVVFHTAYTDSSTQTPDSASTTGAGQLKMAVTGETNPGSGTMNMENIRQPVSISQQSGLSQAEIIHNAESPQDSSSVPLTMAQTETTSDQPGDFQMKAAQQVVNSLQTADIPARQTEAVPLQAAAVKEETGSGDEPQASGPKNPAAAIATDLKTGDVTDVVLTSKTPDDKPAAQISDTIPVKTQSPVESAQNPTSSVIQRETVADNQAAGLTGDSETAATEKKEEQSGKAVDLTSSYSISDRRTVVQISDASSQVGKPVQKQITDQILINYNQNKTEFQMELYPEKLGKVLVKLSMKNNVLTVAISAENSKTQSLLLAHSGRIQSILQDSVDQPVQMIDAQPKQWYQQNQDNPQQSRQQEQRQRQDSTVYRDDTDNQNGEDFLTLMQRLRLQTITI